jgi:Mn-dependent DtxR family transcriptional regulator
MYLESILVLGEKSKYVRSIDVARLMGVSKPSVSRAVGILKSAGYVCVDADGHLSLTDEGEQIARKMYERHRILTSFLVSLGVEKNCASEDACKIEHRISDESFKAIKRFVDSENAK